LGLGPVGKLERKQTKEYTRIFPMFFVFCILFLFLFFIFKFAEKKIINGFFLFFFRNPIPFHKEKDYFCHFLKEHVFFFLGKLIVIPIEIISYF
jgi:ABC-type polysaccharide transport system permease subunit